MARFVDAEKLKEAYKCVAIDEGAKKFLDRLIDIQPDVIDCTKGAWVHKLEVDYPGIPTYHFYCSVCGEESWETTTFCPHCGAQLKGWCDK